MRAPASTKQQPVARAAATPPLAQPAETAAAEPAQRPPDEPMARIMSFPLAQTGEGIAECELVEWAVKEGNLVAEFDLLCTVQSDKASVEITSPFSGIVHKLHHVKGDVVKVGAPLMDFEVAHTGVAPEQGGPVLPGPGEVAPGQGSSEESAPPGCHQAEQSAPGRTAVRATPAVRQLARDLGVDLASCLPPTGPEGRVVAEDVQRAADRSQATHIQQPSPAAQVIPVRSYRRAMIKAMTAAQEVPLFHYHDEVCLDELLRIRQQLRGNPALNGAKLTVLPFMLKALSLMLSSPEHALLNSSLYLPHQGNISADANARAQDASIRLHADHNIGVAMATSQGLVVPNIKQVQKKTVLEITYELQHLAAAAAAASLSPHELQGGTITVSNIGAIGGLLANPLVSPPQVAIVALGRMRQIPQLIKPGRSPHELPAPEARLGHDLGSEGWRLTTRSSLGLSWGADHRVVDGAGLALANNAWKAIMEEPSRMLLALR